MIQQSRRGFLLGLLAAPVIVKAASLMPIKAPKIIKYDWVEAAFGPRITVGPNYLWCGANNWRIYQEIICANNELTERVLSDARLAS